MDRRSPRRPTAARSIARVRRRRGSSRAVQRAAPPGGRGVALGSASGCDVGPASRRRSSRQGNERRRGVRRGRGRRRRRRRGNGGVWGALGRFELASESRAPTYNAVPAYAPARGLAEFSRGGSGRGGRPRERRRAEDDAERETRWRSTSPLGRCLRISTVQSRRRGTSEAGGGNDRRRKATAVRASSETPKMRGAAPHASRRWKVRVRHGPLGLRQRARRLGRRRVAGPRADADLLVTRARVSNARAGGAGRSRRAGEPTRGSRRAASERRNGGSTRSARSIEDRTLSCEFCSKTRTRASRRSRGRATRTATAAARRGQAPGQDHAFDGGRWRRELGAPAARCGSPRCACAAIAASLGETRAVASLDAAGARGAALNDALWVEPPGGTAATNSSASSSTRIRIGDRFSKNGRVTAGYFRHDRRRRAPEPSSAARWSGVGAGDTGLAPRIPARTRERWRRCSNEPRVTAFPPTPPPSRFDVRNRMVRRAFRERFEADAAERARHQAVVANLHSGERWPALAYVCLCRRAGDRFAALPGASVPEVQVAETDRDDADRARWCGRRGRRHARRTTRRGRAGSRFARPAMG